MKEAKVPYPTFKITLYKTMFECPHCNWQNIHSSTFDCGSVDIKCKQCENLLHLKWKCKL